MNICNNCGEIFYKTNKSHQTREACLCEKCYKNQKKNKAGRMPYYIDTEVAKKHQSQILDEIKC
jgi:DNA-directed RNA polymerase subunit M/transcription elongation factor TFIIS